MAHDAQRVFIEGVRDRFPDFFEGKKVLDIGSLNINGSMRYAFKNCDYTGIDVGEGRGVDVVAGGHEFDAPDATYDVCLSAECFEHNPHWKETFINMYRMCKPGGLILMTCATTGRKEHGTSRSKPGNSPLTQDLWDYYKNLTEEDFTSDEGLTPFINSSTEYEFSTNMECNDLYFWAIR